MNFVKMYDEYDQADPAHEVLAAGDDEAYRSLKMTVKVPPALDMPKQTALSHTKNQLKSGSR